MVDRNTKGSTEQSIGWILLATGLLLWSGTLLVGDGLTHGLLQGAVIVAMVAAAFSFGASARAARAAGPDREREDGAWLPSRDGDR